MPPVLSATSVVSVHLDDFVQLGFLLTGDVGRAEQLVRLSVLEVLPRWSVLDREPEHDVRLEMARRFAAGSPRRRHQAMAMLQLVNDETDEVLARGFHRSAAGVHRMTVEAIADLRLRLSTEFPDRRWNDAAIGDHFAALVAHVRSSPALRVALLAAAARSVRPAEPEEHRPRWHRPGRRAVIGSSLLAAAALVLAAIPVSRMVHQESGAASDAAGAQPVPSTMGRPATTSMGVPVAAGKLIGAPCENAGSAGLSPLADPTQAEVVALCWPIRSGAVTVWATGLLDPGTPEGTIALASLGELTDRGCESVRTPAGPYASPIRPALLEGYAVRYGCLPTGDDAAGATYRTIAEQVHWTIPVNFTQCNPRVSDGQAYRPYQRLLDESWDTGILCVDSPGDGRQTLYLVLTGERLAKVKSLVDDWAAAQGLAFCQDSDERSPRVALWLSKDSTIGQVQGVFGPRGCALSPELVTAFRMLANPANRNLALPDLTGQDLPEAIRTLARSGFGET